MRENRYCGPYALAHVGRMSTGEAAALFRQLSGRKWIKRVHFADMNMALRLVAQVLVINDFRHQERQPTMAEWARKHRRTAELCAGSRGTWVIALSTHYIVLRGSTIWDNVHHDGIHFKDYMRRARVKKAWLVA